MKDIIAYSEKESYDPITGEPGILRKEWRVRMVKDYRPGELDAAFGPDWRRYKPFATHVLEHRYIRRGVEEPWTPHHAATGYKDVLQEVDSSRNLVVLDPTLQNLLRVQEEYAVEQKAKEEALQEQEATAKTRRYDKKRSEEAFVRLAASKWAELTEQWVAFIKGHDTLEYRERAKNDPEFMRFYNAVMDSNTVPAKRKAIREFLSYVAGSGYADYEDGGSYR